MTELPVSPRPKVRVVSTHDEILRGLSHCLEPHFKLEWVQAERWDDQRPHMDVDVVIQTDPASVMPGDILLVSDVQGQTDWHQVVWPLESESLFIELVRSVAQSKRQRRSEQWNMDQAILDVLQTDQQAGRSIQMRMLPSEPLVRPSLSVELGFFPSLLLSGDFADYFEADRSSRVMVLLADVAGHGVSSAMVTVVIKNLLNRLRRNLARGSSFDLLSPARVLERINNELQFTALGKHATVFCGLVDTEQGSLTYSVAGHTPMPVLVQGGQAQVLQGKGRPVGLFDEVDYSETVIQLQGRYHLGIASDGILDLLSGRNTQERTQALTQAFENSHGRLAEVTSQLAWHDGKALPDDVTLVMVSGEQ